MQPWELENLPFVSLQAAAYKLRVVGDPFITGQIKRELPQTAPLNNLCSHPCTISMTWVVSCYSVTASPTASRLKSPTPVGGWPNSNLRRGTRETYRQLPRRINQPERVSPRGSPHTYSGIPTEPLQGRRDSRWIPLLDISGIRASNNSAICPTS